MAISVSSSVVVQGFKGYGNPHMKLPKMAQFHDD
jgi:hypothetical protein